MSTEQHIPVVVTLIALVTYSAGCIVDSPQQSAERQGTQELSQEVQNELLAVAVQYPEVSAFIAEKPAYHYEITVLSPANLTALARTYPVIYGNLPNTTLYQIDYIDGQGLLVIVDLGNKTVVRYFRTTGVQLT
jgi:hypothetical protein